MFIVLFPFVSSALIERIPIKDCQNTFPNIQECKLKNWDLGKDTKDPCRPLHIPLIGQQVYIQDPLNFCLNLPNPNNEYLKKTIYDKGRLPSILEGEGFVHAFCMGSYLSPGASKINPKGIKSAHVIINQYPNGKKYIEISGRMDCRKLGIKCNGNNYDDGGQYDSVSFRHCGKEPYSGVDSSKHFNMTSYVQQGFAF